MSQLLRAISWLVNVLPERWALLLGAGLGLLWYHIIPIRRRVVMENLNFALGSDYDRRALKKIARSMYRNLGISAIEFLRVKGLTPDNVRAKIKMEGLAHLEAAQAQGRGVLILTAHFGNWDLLCCSQALAGFPLHVITKNLKAGKINKFWMETRQRCGVTLLGARGSLKNILRALRDNQIVAFVIDQNMLPSHGIFVDFFGKSACTTPSLALLAERTGAPVVPIFMVREGLGSHRIVVKEALTYHKVGERRDNVRHNTRIYSAILEDMIRAWPDHWLWLHRRWKTRPIDELKGAKGKEENSIGKEEDSK